MYNGRCKNGMDVLEVFGNRIMEMLVESIDCMILGNF